MFRSYMNSKGWIELNKERPVSKKRRAKENCQKEKGKINEKRKGMPGSLEENQWDQKEAKKGKKPNQIKEKMDAWLSTRKPMRLWKGGNNLEMLAPERKSRWEKRTNKSGQEQIFIEINKSVSIFFNQQFLLKLATKINTFYW